MIPIRNFKGWLAAVIFLTAFPEHISRRGGTLRKIIHQQKLYLCKKYEKNVKLYFFA